MKYLKQFSIIVLISFAGEFLNAVLPLPVPASIYGILILFICLKSGIIPLSAIKETSAFFIEIMPVLFLPAAVGLLDSWDILSDTWLAYLAICLISTILVMGISGLVTQLILKRNGDGPAHE